MEQRKTRIIEMATTLFLEKGFAETSLVDIAKQSGVATRTIYQHYGNKEDIFRAVMANNSFGSAPDLPVIDADTSLFDVLFRTADFVFAYSLTGESLPILRLMVAENQRFPTLMRETFEVLHDRLHGSVVEIFEGLAAEGKIPAGNHTQSVKYFIDLLLGNSPMQLNMNWIKSGPSDEEIRDKIALFMLGRFGIKPDGEATLPAGKKKARRKKRN